MAEQDEIPQPGSLRSPIVCVLGHLDSGKTTLLDFLRKSCIQKNEVGGITQEICITSITSAALVDYISGVNNKVDVIIPGIMMIDTPGLEQYSLMRLRGCSLCDMAVVMIDINHGVEDQTLESLEMLKKKQIPFIVVVNKLNLLKKWSSSNHSTDFTDLINSQDEYVKQQFENRMSTIIKELETHGVNSCLFNDPISVDCVPLVPVCAYTGDGIGNMINVIIKMCQSDLTDKVRYRNELNVSVLRLEMIPNVDVTLYYYSSLLIANGSLKSGDSLVLNGLGKPLVLDIKCLLTRCPFKPFQDKNAFMWNSIAYGTCVVKVLCSVKDGSSDLTVNNFIQL